MVINPSIADDEISATIEKTTQFITDRGGSVADVNQWGRRKLAYPIHHFSEGNYVLAQFSLDPKIASELEASLELSEDILRYLVVRLGD